MGVSRGKFFGFEVENRGCGYNWGAVISRAFTVDIIKDISVELVSLKTTLLLKNKTVSKSGGVAVSPLPSSLSTI